MFARMCGRAWLKCKADPSGELRGRTEYSLTKKGREELRLLRSSVEGLYREVVRGVCMNGGQS